MKAENQAFAFGQVISGFNFTNRDAEKKRIYNNIKAGVNTILISPRRWGKSSLIKQVAKEFSDKEIKFCFLDLFSIKDENEFYKVYAEALIKATSSKTDEMVQNTSKFLKSFLPVLSFGNGIDSDIDLKFNVEDVKRTHDAILNLAESIAIDKNIRLVVCLDEFQNISEFEDGLAFQKKLRSFWQHHHNVVYCMYGSKMSMMSELFTKRKNPFFNYGDIIFLEKIQKEHLVKYIIERFEQTGKQIEPAFAERITDLMECHPHYVQHLAHLVWHETDGEVKAENIDEGLQLLLNSYSPMFYRIYEELSKIQVNYLKAIASGRTTLLTSKEAVQTFDMGTPASVLKAIMALEKKEIIDTMISKTEFLDPVFKIWFKKVLRIY